MDWFEKLIFFREEAFAEIEEKERAEQIAWEQMQRDMEITPAEITERQKIWESCHH